MRAGRQAGRADIADHLALADMLAGRNRDPAHMRIAGAHVAAVAELDEIAMPAVPPGEVHHAVGDRIDRRAIAGAKIDALVEAVIAEQRVKAHAEAGGLIACDRTRQARALLADAGGVEPFGAP